MSGSTQLAPETHTVPNTMLATLDSMLDALVGVDAMISGLHGARAELVNEIRVWGELMESMSENSTAQSRDLARRSMRAEVACALRLPERSVENLFGVSRQLIDDLPATLAALKKGEISYRHAQIMVDETAGLSLKHAGDLERLGLAVAVSSTPSAFERKARALREGLDPSSIGERTVNALDKREASWMPGRDGMGWLTLYLAAADGLAIMARASDAALKLKTPDEQRTLTQLRADVLRDAMLCGARAAAGTANIRPDVSVTVPVLTLMGLSEQPATLEGYGPIDPDTARRLAAGAPSFTRILTHPETGVMLSMSRELYSAPTALRRRVKTRGPTCGFYGCNRSADECDLDHTRDWALGGHTEFSNLAYLCRGHHTVKHNTAWSVTQAADGSGHLTWTSPSGRTYVKVPDGALPATTELPPF